MSKLRMASLLFFLFVLAVSAISQSPNSLDEKIPVRLLKEDFSTLRSKLESSQPGLYLYTRKDSLDKIFDLMNNSLTEPMTSAEFYRKIAPLNKVLRNLHTLFWASAAYQKGAETGLPRFPLDIHWLDGRMYILRNNSVNPDIVAGSAVNRINGQNVDTIFKTLLEGTTRDGYNETYPIARASRNFGFYYAQLFGTPKTFVIELTSPDGSEQKIELEGVTATEIDKTRIAKHDRRYSQYSEDWEAWISKKEPALRLEIRKDVAIMTLRTFHTWTIEANGQKYEEFIKDAFTQLASNKITSLIIDLRNNHGGHDLVGMSLMSYLHDSVFYYYKKRTSLVKPIGKSEKKGSMYEIAGRKGWIGKVVPAKPMYTGNVFVLMNGYSASATGEFIGHLKNINRAVFIGEEAGGNPVVFMGGQSLPVDLPHTRITGILPLILNEMNVELENNGHGVIPDYYIKPTITDILQEKDVEMEFVINLIQKKHIN